MQREDFDDVYTPTWKGTIEGLTWNLIKGHRWRFRGFFDDDDLYQECYIAFLRCVERYPHVIEAPHFVALYRRVVENHFHKLSRVATNARSERTGLKSRGQGGEQDHTGALDLVAVVPSIDDRRDEEFAERLKSAPFELQQLVAALDKKGRPRKHRREREAVVTIGGRTTFLAARETTNQLLCRIAGFDPQKVDLRTPLWKLVRT